MELEIVGDNCNQISLAHFFNYTYLELLEFLLKLHSLYFVLIIDFYTGLSTVVVVWGGGGNVTVIGLPNWLTC